MEKTELKEHGVKNVIIDHNATYVLGVRWKWTLDLAQHFHPICSYFRPIIDKCQERTQRKACYEEDDESKLESY
jgi:hypothetical protein